MLHRDGDRLLFYAVYRNHIEAVRLLVVEWRNFGRIDERALNKGINIAANRGYAEIQQLLEECQREA
jgi:hypothetical protein